MRPCTEAACVQRADTSVGPYRGSNVDLYLGGVAIVWSVQRAGHAPPLQGTDVFGISLGLRALNACSGRGKPRPYKATRQVCHLRRERACPFRRTQERSVTWRSDLFILLLSRRQICLPRVRARRPGAGRGYGVQRIRGTGAGSPDPLALAERAENKSSD